MKDIFKVWAEVEDILDDKEEIDVHDFLKQHGYDKTQVSPSISENSEALLTATFNPELLPKDTQLSKYKILEQVNSGGQGEIYLAERSDGLYNKTVIIKFIAQRYSFDKLRQQFLQEMQLLADLNHPGIVQIIDGGLTKDNQPWLVLEYINGLHIDEYCQELRLSNDEIVKLFINICEALNFVHQRSVVHMDIKANNILIHDVNKVPYPVIIDFGISNINDDSKEPLSQAEIFGTAGYSAPEQIATGKADNRADIYSLGMLLAQLLTKKSVLNIGLESEKDRLSLLKKHHVSRDLVHIIEKATQENIDNRYNNIEALQLDFNNYLHHLPLIANQNHLGHIFYKTLKRHRLAALLTLLVFVSAMAFTIKYTTDISQLQQVTVKEKNSTDELYNFMLTELFTSLSQVGRIDILKLVTEKSIEHLKKQDSRINDAKSHLQTSIAYSNAGKVFDALDLSTDALNAYEKATVSINYLVNNNDYQHDYFNQLAKIKNLKAKSLTSDGQEKLTEQNLLESLKLSSRLYQDNPNEDLSLAYESHIQLGWYYMDYDQPKKALIHIMQAIADANEMNGRLDSDHVNYDWVFNLSQAYQVLAWYEYDYGQAERTIDNLILSIQLANKTVDEKGNNIKYEFNQTTLLNQLSFIYLENNKLQEAQNTIQKAITIGINLQQKAPKNMDYQRELAYSYTTAGQILETKGNLKAALSWFKKGIKISKIISQNDNKNFSSANDYATDLIHIGMIYDKLKQNDIALQYWNKSIAIVKPINLLEPNNKYYMNTLVIALVNTKQYDQARPLIASLKKAGFNDNEFNALLKKHNL